MKNRTIYDVLNQVMEDYSYSLKKTGNKVDVTGTVYIERLDMEVKHSKTIYLADTDRMSGLESAISTFKDELKNKVAEVVKAHAEELTDDEEMISKLQYEMKELKRNLEVAEKALVEARERINELEMERLINIPWVNPNPWVTGITWNNSGGTGTPPNEWDFRITCDENSAVSCGGYEDGYRSDCTAADFNRKWSQDTLNDFFERYRNMRRKNGED